MVSDQKTRIVGPAGATGDNLVAFNSTTGYLAKDSGVASSNLVLKNSTDSITGAKTFDKDKILMKGTSTGVTTFSTANTGASNFTVTFQAANGTCAYSTDTLYIGTTSVALNRGSGALSLAGVSIDGNAGTATYVKGGSGGTILYQSALDTTAFLANGSAGQMLRCGGGTSAPAWSTPTFPNTATSGKVLIGNGTNWVESTPTYPNASATAGKILVSDGTNFVASTPTYPNASATTRKIIVSDGTNFVASTETYAVPGTSGNVLTSDGTNWTSAAPASTVPNSLYQTISDSLIGVVNENASFVPKYAYPDVFTVAAGKASTVDTANTTAICLSSAYINATSVGVEIPDTANPAGVTGKTGVRASFTEAVVITKITKDSNCTATKAYIHASGGTLLATATFSGNDATFNYECAASTAYRFVVGSDGSSYDRTYTAGGLPLTSGSCTVAAGGTDTADDGTPANPLSVRYIYYASATSGVQDAVVKSAALTRLNGAIAKAGLFIYDYSVAANASITFDVDITGDGTYEYTDKAINQMHAIPETLSGAKIRLNFVKSTSTSTCSVKGWDFVVVP